MHLVQGRAEALRNGDRQTPGLIVRQVPAALECIDAPVAIGYEAGEQLRAPEQIEHGRRIREGGLPLPRVLGVRAPPIRAGRADARVGGVVEDVADALQQALVGFDGVAEEPPLEKMAAAPAAGVQVEGIPAENLVHERAQSAFGIIEQQVHVIAHQAPCDDAQTEFPPAAIEEIQELQPVGIVPEDRLPVVAAVHHMVVPGLGALPRGPHGDSPFPSAHNSHEVGSPHEADLGFQACTEEGWILMPALRMRHTV